MDKDIILSLWYPLVLTSIYCESKMEKQDLQAGEIQILQLARSRSEAPKQESINVVLKRLKIRLENSRNILG